MKIRQIKFEFMKRLMLIGGGMVSSLASGATMVLGGSGDTAVIGSTAGSTLNGSGVLIVGSTNEIWGSYSVVIGSQNTQNASGTLIVGWSNQLSGHSSVAFGESNIIEAPRSFVVGKYNFAGQNDNEDAVFVSGAYNASTAYAAFVTGVYNTVTWQGAGSITAGSGNFNNAGSSLVVGTGHSLESYKHATAIVGGAYSKTPDAPALLVIGNGTGPSASNRKNALIVHANGDLIVPKVQGDISMGVYGN